MIKSYCQQDHGDLKSGKRPDNNFSSAPHQSPLYNQRNKCSDQDRAYNRISK